MYHSRDLPLKPHKDANGEERVSDRIDLVIYCRNKRVKNQGMILYSITICNHKVLREAKSEELEIHAVDELDASILSTDSTPFEVNERDGDAPDVHGDTPDVHVDVNQEYVGNPTSVEDTSDQPICVAQEESKTESLNVPIAVELPTSCRVFGAYQGSFKIPNHKGIEEEISESFFFYSFHSNATTALGSVAEDGEEASNVLSMEGPFSDLPPAPRVRS